MDEITTITDDQVIIPYNVSMREAKMIAKNILIMFINTNSLLAKDIKKYHQKALDDFSAKKELIKKPTRGPHV